MYQVKTIANFVIPKGIVTDKEYENLGNEQNVCVLFVSCAGFWRMEAAYFLAKSLALSCGAVIVNAFIKCVYHTYMDVGKPVTMIILSKEGNIMSVNMDAINSAYTYQNKVSRTDASNAPAAAEAASSAASASSGFSDEAVVFERSDAVYPKAKESDVDTDSVSELASGEVDRESIVKQLKADSEAREQSLIDMVKETLGQQVANAKGANGKTIAEIISDGIEEAKAAGEDPDEYWGVEKTAQRIVDFAKSISGGNTAYIDKLREAFKEGYGQAESSFGGKLPQISKDTYDRVMELFDEWENE